MVEPVATIASVVINVVDLDREQEFWTELLGVEVAREVPGFFVWLRPQHPGGISLALQKVDEHAPGRSPVHLDHGVDDVGAAVARIEALGGRLVEEHEIGGFAWKVMADPEDNVFCIVERG